MDISLLSLVLFSIITFMYFAFIKPQLTLDNLSNMETYISSTYSTLAIYLVLILVSQLGLNISYLATKCNGNMAKNSLVAVIYTLVPWLLMFGIMIAVLLMFPAFKNVFSDVIGYYVVYSSANEIFSKILIDSTINEATTEENREQIKTAAELIMKMVGNKSLLINELNPMNFDTIWTTLKPLRVAEYYTTSVKHYGTFTQEY